MDREGKKAYHNYARALEVMPGFAGYCCSDNLYFYKAIYLIKWITSDFIPHLRSYNNWDMCIGMKTRNVISLQAKERNFC